MAATLRIAIYPKTDKRFEVSTQRDYGNGYCLLRALLTSGDWLLFLHAAQTELDQVFGLELSTGPAVPLLKLHTDQVIIPVMLAVFYAGLAAMVAWKLQRNKCIW